MKDIECVRFLQWVLPQLKMRWPGFQKVRKQVCKRIARRIGELSLSNLQAYRQHLWDNQDEWRVLDGLCRVSISCFYRDKRVFGMLQEAYLPTLVQRLLKQGDSELRVWCAGCASGEEPYSLALLWAFVLSDRFPELRLHILATDADPLLLARAETACYAYGSIKNLPESWRDRAFVHTDDRYCLLRSYARPVEFHRQDVRDIMPDGPFHLVLCRNLVFTYFETRLQQAFLNRLEPAMLPSGVLLLGAHESLPESGHGFAATSARWGLYELSRSPKPTALCR